MCSSVRFVYRPAVEGEIVAAIFILILWILLGAIPPKIAADRGIAGSSALWWIGGMLLFIFALPVALLMKPDPNLVEKKAVDSGGSKKCPQCAELVKNNANKCRFCGHDFPQIAPGIAGLIKRPNCRHQIPQNLTRCTFWRRVVASLVTLSISLLLGLSLLPAQSIYKWKDEKGRWHFSQMPG